MKQDPIKVMIGGIDPNKIKKRRNRNMVKSFIKCCLIGALACSLSTSAMAMGLVSGVLSMAFGQENLGDPDKSVDRDEASHWSNHWLGSIGLEAIGQPISAQVKLKFKSGRPERTDEPQFEGEEMQINYQAMDNLKIGFGHFDLESSLGFSKSAAAPTQPFMPGNYNVAYAEAKGYGAAVEFKASDSLVFNLALFSSDPFRQSYLRDRSGPPDAVDFTNGSKIEDKDQPGAGGSGMALTVNGFVGPIGYKAAYLSGTSKDDTSSDVDPISSSAIMTSLKYSMIGVFDVAIDYETMNKGWRNKDSAKLATNTGLHVAVPNIGPGTLLASYGMEALKFKMKYTDFGGSKVDKEIATSTIVYSNLGYEIPMESLSFINFYYTSATETWTDDFKDLK